MIFKINFKFNKLFIGVAAVLAVAGCASDSSDPARAGKATTVSVMDPYAINCVVTDAAGNVATAIDEANSPGRYKFLSTTNIGEITATNCVDAATNLPLPTFKAPAPTTSDESVVTPITTVITAMMSGGMTAINAEAAISQKFPNLDLLTFEPLACLDTCEGILVQSFSNQLTVAIVMLQAAVENDAAVVTALATAYASAYASGSAIDLTSVSDMTTIANAAKVPANVSAGIADVISRVNTQIDLAADASTATPEQMTAALTRMTAGVIVASNLVTDVAAAVLAKNTDALDLLTPATLISDAEADVEPAGFTSKTEGELTGSAG